MTQNLAWTEMMLIVVFAFAILVAREFYRSRNGTLRKLMIAYFVIEAFVYGTSALYFYLYDQHITTIGVDTFRLIVIAPKFVMKICLLIWLLKK